MQRSDNGEASSYNNYTAASVAGGESTPQSKLQSSARCSPACSRPPAIACTYKFTVPKHVKHAQVSMDSPQSLVPC